MRNWSTSCRRRRRRQHHQKQSRSREPKALQVAESVASSRENPVAHIQSGWRIVLPRNDKRGISKLCFYGESGSALKQSCFRLVTLESPAPPEPIFRVLLRDTAKSSTQRQTAKHQYAIHNQKKHGDRTTTFLRLPPSTTETGGGGRISMSRLLETIVRSHGEFRTWNTLISTKRV